MGKFPPHTKWDIFCSVIDNYGDIGVCWRLARQLAHEQNQCVRLWVDDLYSFQKLCPVINPQLTEQTIAAIEIRQWHKQWQSIEPADIVIEAFACNIPTAYQQAMQTANKAILWLNLEYLTYEKWSIDFHALPSPQTNQLNKYFFFTGLEETGSVIRESHLLEQAEHFQNNPHLQQQFLSQLGVTKQPDHYLMLLFSYANHGLAEWLDTLQKSDKPYQLLIPQTPLLNNLADYLNIDRSLLIAGYQYQQDALSIQIIPFVTQQDFDKLLWCTDYNLIRGEDSFVRAQYAGKPMLWHIYPQQENAHLTKLQAFLDYYLTDLSAEAQQATIDWWFAWNNQQNLTDSWLNYQQHLPQLEKQAINWAKKQKTVTDLITKLAKLYKNWLS
ncbi:elongation factor P maturation arginine rhamnosyltransferase EarP [Entomomonas asaccharolytica]|uniref:Protein-arginine rhamnosyltransferase n=1 Tax=Entomomonas asaccharolytica TaxID=2785331 RepID=A0A974NEC2_9GAMM|nr:elongation factor P maturation arginine rhamnosyltransferase EarP [Entomomonas asaccharolytica]QQP84912.1 elongation factor P maturation arginine rhamnosyltransferase EarP [Entomomonas asaccharolytica]